MSRLNVNEVRREALFVSGLRRSDAPTPAGLAELVGAAVRRLGVRGCAGRMAQEFGDDPETAADRMRWIRQLVSEVPVARPPRLGGMPLARCCPDAEGPAAGELVVAA
jgi:hypothetical protein